jgi:hypothetical protein
MPSQDKEKLFLEQRYGKRELQLLNTNLLSEDFFFNSVFF